MKKSSGSVLLFLFLSIPVVVNAWKFFGRHYTLYEIWPHLLLDATVMALFLFAIVKNPLESPLIYGGLFLAFALAYLVTNPPHGIVEWLATLFVLLLVGGLAPRLASALPWVLLGLMVSYYGVLRTYLPEINRDEVMEVLAKKSAPETAREFIHTVLGYERNVIGREKYRYFLDPSDDLVAHLRQAGRLHASMKMVMEGEGINDISFGEARAFASGDRITIEGESLPCRRLEKDASGLHIPCVARLEPFVVETKRMADGTYRVSRFPEGLRLRRLP